MLAASVRCQRSDKNIAKLKSANKGWRKRKLWILTTTSTAQMAAAHWTSVSPMKWDHELLFGNARVAVASDEDRGNRPWKHGTSPRWAWFCGMYRSWVKYQAFREYYALLLYSGTVGKGNVLCWRVSPTRRTGFRVKALCLVLVGPPHYRTEVIWGTFILPKCSSGLLRSILTELNLSTSLR